MRQKNLHKHILHYVILLAILSLGLFTITLLKFDRTLQIASVAVTSFAYFIWGIIHHRAEDSLHPRIALEYLLLAAIGATILISVISQT